VNWVAELASDAQRRGQHARNRTMPWTGRADGMITLENNVLDFLGRQAPEALTFLVAEDANVETDVLSVCDTLYVLKLLGRMDLLAPDVGRRFARLLLGHRLAGAIGKGEGPALGVDHTAYALGALNLLETHGQPFHREVLSETGWRKYELLDWACRPLWPWYVTHHAWRAGQWIGGTPSIVMSLWRLSPDLAVRNRLPSASTVLDSSDTLIDGDTGLFRVYRMPALQFAFRMGYRLRHHPDAGDIGGVAHLHWSNYAAGRLPYKGARALFDRTWSLLQREPFMEKAPYGLDFEVVQIARTAIPDGDARRTQLYDRFCRYADDLADFYSNPLNAAYALHKLPGGLAALHDCALAVELDHVPGLVVAPVDIAKEAYWI